MKDRVSLGSVLVFCFRFQDLSEGEENEKILIGDVLNKRGPHGGRLCQILTNRTERHELKA